MKYLYKYVYKGQDRITVTFKNQQRGDGSCVDDDRQDDHRDEIQEYLDARFLSPPEACSSFPCSESIMRL